MGTHVVDPDDISDPNIDLQEGRVGASYGRWSALVLTVAGSTRIWSFGSGLWAR